MDPKFFRKYTDLVEGRGIDDMKFYANTHNLADFLKELAISGDPAQKSMIRNILTDALRKLKV